MMVSPSELSLDYKPHSYPMLPKSFGEQTDQTQKLEEFVARLEEERLKIDAFKRELPLCMQLLTNAMEASRQQLQSNRANQGPRPVLEEFIPLKHSSSEGSEKATNMSDKADWMTSAQLWSQASHEEISKPPQNTIISPKTEICFGVSAKLSLDDKQRSGGAFHPFSKERNSCHSPMALPDLALASVNKEILEDKKLSEAETGISYSRIDISCNGGNIVTAGIHQDKGAETAAEGETATTTNSTNTTQTHRKARRCWSPELHRRFVNALQMLGGSQVATPKQIRELMKVDGLTNDEVKSHLQKYRLHTRRPSPSPQAAGTQPPRVVVLGGIWVPQDYSTAAAHGGAPTLYGAHPTAHASPLYCAPQAPQEYYPTPPQPHHQLHHHHALHHQLQVYKATSPTHSMPESDGRGAGDRSESIEDGRSTSGSWKGDSCGNNGGGERRMLAMREEGDQEGNGSLKF
ncbi:myb family transcription factor EFM-like [Cornus florida]|uniref:myb family transcription factor EFM-like n=1 Tax=Cornus florida TaxID=4283 RepID=UPI0028998751|nr:myb family transcription factor EFM-like [Cornus florida]